MGENDSDSSCVDNPETTKIITCPTEQPYCSLLRIEYKDPKNVIASISRTCTGQNKNSVEEDTTFRYYFKSCTTDLCNGGSGKSVSSDAGYLGDKSTIYAPGTGNSATSTTLSTLTIVCASLFYLFAKI